MNHEKYIGIITVVLLFLTNLTFAQGIEKGILDLRDTSLETSISIQGEWEFYYNEMLTADEIESKKEKSGADE